MPGTNENTEIAQLPQEAVIQKLAATFPEDEQKEILRDMFIVTQIKTIARREEYEDDRGYTKSKTVKRKMNPFEAIAYVMLCRKLGFEPALDHITMLEDRFYIGLDGHKQYAHLTGELLGMEATLVEEKEIEYEKEEWVGGEGGGKKSKVVTKKKGKQYRFECIVERKMGDKVAKFKGTGIADPSNVVGNPSDLKLMQMAEARSKRRALSDGFPPGMGHIEDVSEYPDYQLAAPEEAPMLPENTDKFKRPEVISAPAQAQAPAPATAPDPTPEAVEEPKEEKEETQKPLPPVRKTAKENLTEKQEESYKSVKSDPRYEQAFGKATPAENIPAAEPEEKEEEAPAPAEEAPATSEDVAAVFGEQEEAKEESKDPYEILDLNEAELKARQVEAKEKFKLAMRADKENPTEETKNARGVASGECAAINNLIIQRGYSIV